MARNPIVGGIGFALEVDDSKFIQQLRKAGERGKRELEGTTTAADRLEDELRQAGVIGERSLRQIETSADRVSDQLARARRNADLLRNTVSGLALGAAFVAGAKTIANFSQSMSTLEAVSGAVGTELDGLRNKALELGASTRFSATQAADAMGELARAGFTANEVLAAIGPTLSAAQAGGADIASTAEIIGSTIRGFGIEATDAARVADVLAQAANASNAGITDLGEALKFAAPTARQLGLDLEETIAIIGKLSDGGLKGGLAGRGFQSLATQIVNNREEIQGLIGDFNLAEEGLGSVLRRLKEAGITTEQIIKLFRAENLDTFGILANAAVDESLNGLEKVLRAAEGSSARAAAIMDDNLNGAILGAMSRLEALIIALGDAGATNALVTALDGLSSLLKLAADNADVLQAAIIALSIRALIPLAASLGRYVIGQIVALQAQLVVLTAIAGRSVTALASTAAVAGRLVFALGPLTLGIAAAAAAYVALARDAQKAERSMNAADDALGKYKETVKRIEDDTRALESANDALTAAISAQGPAARAAAIEEVAAIQDRITANERLAEVYKAQLGAQIAAAENAISTQLAPVEIQGANVAGLRRSGATAAQIKDAVDQFREQTRKDVDAALAAGKPLTVEQREFVIVDADRRQAEERLNSLREAYKAFNKERRDAARDYATPRDFAGQGGNPYQADIDAEMAKIKRLEASIREAEKSGSDGAKRVAQEYRNQIGISQRFIDELNRGIAPDLARQIAEGDRDAKAIQDELENIAQLQKDITTAEANGRGDIVKARKEELVVAEKTLALLQGGIDPEIAREIATPPKAEKGGAADKALEDAKRKVVELNEAYDFQTPIEALKRWKQEQLSAIDQVMESEEDRAAARSKLDAVYQDRYDEIFVAEQKLELETVNAEAAKQRAIEDTLAARDLEIALQLAQLRGDKEQVKALEAKADRQQRINDLVAAGLTLSEATLRADAEIAEIQAGTPGEAEAAKRAFAEGLSGDISSALSNAVRSGDYGAIFQEIINSSAARGLEDAINELADNLANLFANIAFGKDGTGGLFGNVVGGGLTPPIVEAQTAEAVKAATDGAVETATAASVTGLGTAATGAAASTSALATGGTAAAGAASVLTTAFGAVAAAATAAASALAAAAASGTASTANHAVAGALSFGGGRARGGPVVPGKFYEVNEGGIAEMLRIGRKNFLLPGAAGKVTPLAGAQAPAPRERTVARHDIYVHGTGNEEIQRAVDEGVQRSVRIAKTQAGPATADFQMRKG
ncbi:MAG: phage tail tape measure protein [Acidobacteria bacterium]|nr:phage tail tape measure protein [Acidobacteriota bacterium]